METRLIRINNTTVVIKEYILDHYCKAVHKVEYKEMVRDANKEIKAFVAEYKDPNNGLSQQITKTLIDKTISHIKKRK